MNPYNSVSDDFGVYVYLNTKMDLPSGRETVLHFFDGMRKAYPQMTDFDTREGGEFVLPPPDAVPVAPARAAPQPTAAPVASPASGWA